MHAISELKGAMVEAKARTLGEYLVDLPKKRTLHTERAMYEEEYDKLWQAQQAYYPEQLTAGLKAQIHQIIFFQRPAIQDMSKLVGKCELEPSRRRAPKALLEFQEFRILQDINNLKVKDPSNYTVERSLWPEEKQLLLQALQQKESLTWNQIRKLLGLHQNEIFNLETSKTEKLIGNRTAIALRKRLSPAYYDQLNTDQQKALLTDLLTIKDKVALLKRAENHWGMTTEQAYHLATTELEPGYANLSLKAMNKLLPYLRAGKNYYDACNEANYKRKRNDKLVDQLPEPPMLRNPVVQKALYELRRLVNQIIRVHGKPDIIRVEMARELKLSPKAKEAYTKQQNINKKLNQRAAQELFEQGHIQSSDPKMAKSTDLLKYRLWLEANQLCLYTGNTISPNQLFTAEVEIDHILPYSRSLDDSYINKILCFSSENANKRNRTPYEAYSGNEEAYQAMLQRVHHCKTMPFNKKAYFEQQTVDTNEFIERHLSDTKTISKVAKTYLEQLVSRVEVSKGQATARIRQRWQLDAILADPEIVGKNRTDHRHHAIDAFVVALTDRSLLQKLSKISATNGYGQAPSQHRFSMPQPWPNYFNDVRQKIEQMLVSHASNYKIRGALHNETAYGFDPIAKCYVYRKAVNSLTASEIEKIRDPAVKALAKERLAAFNGDFKKAFAQPLLHKNGQLINKVRLEKHCSEKGMLKVMHGGGKHYKYYPFESNHHVEIFEHSETGQRKAIFVTMQEASARAKQRSESVIKQTYPELDAGWRFVMSLAANDIVKVEEGLKQGIYRVQRMSSGDRDEITLQQHMIAVADFDPKNTWRIRSIKDTKHIRKINVNAVGQVYG